MNYSLVSRDLIADCIETMYEAYTADAMITLSGCDKTIPGCLVRQCYDQPLPGWLPGCLAACLAACLLPPGTALLLALSPPRTAVSVSTPCEWPRAARPDRTTSQWLTAR
jgi:hypothetical protein